MLLTFFLNIFERFYMYDQRYSLVVYLWYQGAPGVAGMRGPRGFMGRPGLEVSRKYTDR